MNHRLKFLLCLLVWPATAAAHRESPVRIAAASSLTDVLNTLADDFERISAQPRPVPAFAGSSRVAHQLMAGAPADLVAVADPDWMDTLLEQGIIVGSTQHDLLTNRIVLAVPTGSEQTIQDLSELAGPGWLKIAIAGDSVPAGRYAREALDALGLTGSLAPRFVIAPNVRNTLSLIAQGEVDAGFVYRTDAVAESRVRICHTVDTSLHSPIRYPFALTRSGQSNPTARAFFHFLQGESARARFTAAGFSRSVQAAHPSARKTIPTPQADFVAPLRLSLWVASVSLALSLLPAIGLGWLMARRNFWGKAALSTVLLAPLVLPPVVTGFLLLRLFGRQGPLAGILSTLNLEIAFTQWGAIIAAAVVGFPLLLILTRQAIEGVDPRFPAMAQTLGLSRFAAFRKITLPMAAPGIAAGSVLAFARALGEFGATAMIAGDRPEETRTLALAVYAMAEQPAGEDAAAILVWVSLGLSFVALIAYERLVWRQARRREERP
jgi:molybdate transport system permease protein